MARRYNGEYLAKMNQPEQLAILRQRVAEIDARYKTPPAVSRRTFVEDMLSGQVVETPHGSHFETEKLHARHKRHGSVEISDLIELPEDLLAALSNGAIAKSHPTRWAFLDTETTGLMGSGACAFLIGIGSIDEEGFRVRQFFMRDYREEPSQLHAVAQYLERFDVMITYNGKAFDQPLLEGRFRAARARHPFGRLEHLDLLAGARRLWKRRMENCRLSYLESQVLGVDRGPDIAGALIPYIFFEYVRTRRAAELLPIFQHNVTDIVSLACLTAVVPEAYRNPESIAMRHGADLLGIARWQIAVDRAEQGLMLMRRAVDLGLADHLLFPTMLEIALLERKLGNEAASLAALTDLAASRNPCRARAYEELAKYYEHRERNYAMALEMTRSARELRETPEVRHRELRLRTKLSASPGASASAGPRGRAKSSRRSRAERKAQ